MVVTSVVCPILLVRLCHGRVIAAAQLRKNSPRGSLRHLGKRSKYNHVEGWVKGKEQQKSFFEKGCGIRQHRVRTKTWDCGALFD